MKIAFVVTLLFGCVGSFVAGFAVAEKVMKQSVQFNEDWCNVMIEQAKRSCGK